MVATCLKISIVYQVLYRHYFWRQSWRVDAHIPISQTIKVEHGRLSISILSCWLIATLPLAQSGRPAPSFLPTACPLMWLAAILLLYPTPPVITIPKKVFETPQWTTGPTDLSLSRILCLTRSSAWGWKPITTIWSTNKQQINFTMWQAKVLLRDIYKTPWAVTLQRA